MAQPEANYKIRTTNVSSYNIIAHDHHVPPSPPFGPVQRTVRIDPRIDYESPRGGGREAHQTHREQHGNEHWSNQNEKERARHQESDYNTPTNYRTWEDEIRHANHIPASPLYRLGQGQGGAEADPRHGGYHGDGRQDDVGKDYQGQVRDVDEREASQNKPNIKGYGSLVGTIGNVNDVPVSPLYRPGMGRGLNLADPRYGSPQRRGQPEYHETPRPKQPPTPDFNTTDLHIPNNHKDELKLQLGGHADVQEDLRDYKTNNAAWAGYQDRPVFHGPPYSDRPGFKGDRSNRENPWTSRGQVLSFVSDPRIGGYHDGIGLGGNRNGGALLFVRFARGQGENVNVAAHAFLKSKTQDTGGRFLGLAKEVFDFGYERGPTEGIGVFHFPSTEKASIFFQSDPILRQPDFPPPNGHAESWIVNNAYLPDNLQLFSTFLLSEIELHSGKDKRDFFETFQKPFESYLYKNGAMPFVVCSYDEHDRKSLRRHMYPPSSIVTCHLFQGLDHLNWITNDETYSKFRSLHNQMAVEKCSIFNINRDMFP